MFEKLREAARPVLLWSGGSDSTLVLALLREQPIDFDIVIFGRERWTRAQKQRVDALIKKWNLKCFSYPPISQNLVGNGTLSAVFEYVIGQGTVPLVQDLVDGDRCLFDVLEGHRCTATPFEWDLWITGGRQDDTHYIQTPVPSMEWTVSGKHFYAPLFDKTREWVKDELKKRGLDMTATDTEDTGNLVCCHNCLKGGKVFCPKEGKEIDSLIWDAEANLMAFRNSLGVKL